MELIKLKDKNALIFDFDGVIINSVDLKNEAFIDLYKKEKNFTEIKEYLIRNQGIPRRLKITEIEEKLIKNIYKNRESKLKEIERRMDILNESIINKVLKAELIVDALEFIKKNNEKIIGLVSATPDKELIQILKKKNLTGYFDFVYGSHWSKHKTFEYLKKRYDLKESEMIYFGDSIGDKTSASSANIDFYGIGPLYNNQKFENLE